MLFFHFEACFYVLTNENKNSLEFPGGPVVGTLCFHCWGPRLTPKISQAMWHGKKNSSIIFIFLYFPNFTLIINFTYCYITSLPTLLAFHVAQQWWICLSVEDERDSGSIPGLREYPGVRNGNPLWYSCLENSIDRGARWATIHGVIVRHDWANTYTHIFKI